MNIKDLSFEAFQQLLDRYFDSKANQQSTIARSDTGKIHWQGCGELIGNMKDNFHVDLFMLAAHSPSDSTITQEENLALLKFHMRLAQDLGLYFEFIAEDKSNQMELGSNLSYHGNVYQTSNMYKIRFYPKNVSNNYNGTKSHHTFLRFMYDRSYEKVIYLVWLMKFAHPEWSAQRCFRNATVIKNWSNNRSILNSLAQYLSFTNWNFLKQSWNNSNSTYVIKSKSGEEEFRISGAFIPNPMSLYQSLTENSVGNTGVSQIACWAGPYMTKSVFEYLKPLSELHERHIELQQLEELDEYLKSFESDEYIGQHTHKC